MADQKSVLPPMSAVPSVPAPSGAALSVELKGGDDLGASSSKDVLIGGGAMLILAILFFVMRNAYVNYLVGSKKRSPNNAGLAGWGLFGGLLFGSAIGCLALVNKSYLQVLYIGPLTALSFGCFILAFVIASKK